MNESIQTNPEMQFILLALRAALGDENSVAELRGLIANITESSVDLETVMTLARRHRVSPLLYKGLESISSSLLGGEDLPATRPHHYAKRCGQVLRIALQAGRGEGVNAFLTDLKRIYVANSVRNIRLLEEMFRVESLMKEQGIKSVPVKGPILAIQAYGDLSLRQFDDLDFLVDEKSIATAGDLLCSQEYEAYHDLSPRERAAHIKLGYEYMVKHRETGDFVELHSSMASDYFGLYMTSDRLLSTTESIQVDDRQVDVLSKKDTLLLLCEHAYKHSWDRLSWIADIAALLNSMRDEEKLEWNEIIAEARTAGCLRILCVGCQLAEELFAISMRKEIRAHVAKDPEVGLLAEEVLRWYAREDAEEGNGLDGHGFVLRGREGFRMKARYTMKLLFTPSYSDWKALPLPRQLFFLYYLLRPFRLVIKMGQVRLHSFLCNS